MVGGETGAGGFGGMAASVVADFRARVARRTGAAGMGSTGISGAADVAVAGLMRGRLGFDAGEPGATSEITAVGAGGAGSGTGFVLAAGRPCLDGDAGMGLWSGAFFSRAGRTVRFDFEESAFINRVGRGSVRSGWGKGGSEGAGLSLRRNLGAGA